MVGLLPSSRTVGRIGGLLCDDRAAGPGPSPGSLTRRTRHAAVASHASSLAFAVVFDDRCTVVDLGVLTRMDST